MVRRHHQCAVIAVSNHAVSHWLNVTAALLAAALLFISSDAKALQQDEVPFVSQTTLDDIHSAASYSTLNSNSKLQLGSKFQIRSEQLPLNSSTANSSFEVQSSSPAIMGQWYFTDANSTIRPYVGAGVNYAMPANNPSSNGYDSSLAPSNRYGIASQVGVDYHVSKRWLLNMSVWYLDSKPPQLLEAPSNAASNSEAEYPWLYIFSVGYSF